MCFVYYITPPIILWFLLLPFLDRHEKLKLLIVTAISTTVYALNAYFNNITGYKKNYYNDPMDFEDDYFHMEEYWYLHLILKIFTTFLWAFLCTRWTIQSFHLKRPNIAIFYFVRYLGVIVLGLLTLFGWAHNDPEMKSLCVYLPLIACIWYVAGLYITRRFFSIGIGVIVPALYFYYVGTRVIRNHSRHSDINTERSVVNSELMGSFRLIHFARYLLFSVIIVFSAAAFDKSKAVLNTFYSTECLDLGVNVSFKKRFFINGKRLFKGLLANEINFPKYVIDDIEVCVAIWMKSVPHIPISFHLAQSGNYVFLLMNKLIICCNTHSYSLDLVQNGAISYSFCRVIDNVMDSNANNKVKWKMLKVTREFLDQLYQGYPSTKEHLWRLIYQTPNFVRPISKINWEYFENKLSAEQLSAFRSFSNIAWFVPRNEINEMIKGFEMDLEGFQIKDESDLMLYSQCVAYSTGVIAGIVYCHTACEWPDDFGPKTMRLLKTCGNFAIVSYSVALSNLL